MDASCGPDIWTLAGVTAQSCQFYNLSSISPGAIVLSPQIQVYSLETSQCELTVGNSAGDFTCVNLRDSPPHLLVCGNKDRRYDTLANMCTSSITVTLAHTHMFLSSVWQIKASCDLSFLNVESLMSSDKIVGLSFTPAAGVNCFFLGCIAFL